MDLPASCCPACAARAALPIYGEHRDAMIAQTMIVAQSPGASNRSANIGAVPESGALAFLRAAMLDFGLRLVGVLGIELGMAPEYAP
jgi:hypothetical protein